MAQVKLEYGVTSWTPTQNPTLCYTGDRSFDFLQPSERNNAGGIYCYDKGLAPIRTEPLVWADLSRADTLALETFLINTARGSANPIVYTDPEGDTWNARLFRNGYTRRPNDGAGITYTVRLTLDLESLA